jgi:sterol desaturase/sphingolipid hydroxylase (fatty acid hydroxylase superfamily)
VQQIISLLHLCANSLKGGVIWVSCGFLLFTIVERIFTFRSFKKPWRATFLDLQYAVISMLYQPFIYFILSAIFGYLALLTRVDAHDPGLPAVVFLIELFVVLFIRDCLIYIRHRIFHTHAIWPFHSIHHSSEDVNWTSAVRFHPVESMIESSGEILLFLCCQVVGVDALVLSVAAFLMGSYNLFIHSNLRWTFGPLRHILVSPVQHRWHHSDAPGAMDKNFAAMFAFIDVMLGTFYMPMDVLPETTGLSTGEKAAHPRTLAGQLAYPFRKRPETGADAVQDAGQSSAT